MDLGLAPGNGMKNFHEQARHCFKPPPIRLQDGLPHFGHTIFGKA